MATVNQRLAEIGIDHQVNLQQYTRGVVEKMIAILNEADSDLSSQLAEAISKLPDGAFTLEHLQQLLQSVRELNVQAYARMDAELSNDLLSLVKYEGQFQLQLFEGVIPAQIGFSLTRIIPEQVFAAVMAQPFQGRILKEWAQGLAEDKLQRMQDAIRMGFVENLTTDAIIKKIRGTAAKGYADGLVEIDLRNADAVVKTALSSTAAFTRDQFYKDNSGLIKAVEWVSVLDLRTTVMCRIRDGLNYTAVDHQPIGHSIPWLAGPGALHWRCRSTSVPITKSWQELGVTMDELPPTTRASMDGQVPEKMTYREWLQSQSAARQDQVLGEARAKLMRQGRMSFDSFYSETGAYLSLEQLRTRDAEAFQRAGL